MPVASLSIGTVNWISRAGVKSIIDYDKELWFGLDLQ